MCLPGPSRIHTGSFSLRFIEFNRINLNTEFLIGARCLLPAVYSTKPIHLVWQRLKRYKCRVIGLNYSERLDFWRISSWARAASECRVLFCARWSLYWYRLGTKEACIDWAENSHTRTANWSEYGARFWEARRQHDPSVRSGTCWMRAARFFDCVLRHCRITWHGLCQVVTVGVKKLNRSKRTVRCVCFDM